MKDDKKASVKIYKPNTIMLRYTPSENNENYNACLWADFIKTRMVPRLIF